MPFQPDLLRALREAKGLSQQQLAEQARLSQSVIAKSEKGNNSPGSQVLEKLAQALDCTIDYLHGRGPKYENSLAAAAQMAFEVAQLSLTDEQRERCRRVLRHPEAPKTAGGWLSFAEMLGLAMEPAHSIASFLVKRPAGSNPPASSRRHRIDSGAS
jgi:transcriptional regulator with XRE-family HTH domain